MSRSTNLEKALMPPGINNLPYIGKAPYPYPLIRGKIWIELDAFDDFIEEWVYDGAMWISKNVYTFEFSPNSNNVLNSVLNVTTYPLDPNYKILVLRFVLSGLQNSTSTSTNRWAFGIQALRELSVTSAVALDTIDTFTPPGNTFVANTWNTVIYPINRLVNVTANLLKSIRIQEIRFGTATKIFSYRLEYKKVR
jgi:hypothetical protein